MDYACFRGWHQAGVSDRSLLCITLGPTAEEQARHASAPQRSSVCVCRLHTRPYQTHGQGVRAALVLDVWRVVSSKAVPLPSSPYSLLTVNTQGQHRAHSSVDAAGMIH